MNERCKICIDPQCGGKMDCDCQGCNKKDCCPRVIRPTIRITRKCSQKCSHCCFSCGPDKTNHMTKETAETIAGFLYANEIVYANVMGGEFWLCKDWQKILGTLIAPLGVVRIVTNGDWAANSKKRTSVINFFKRQRGFRQCHIMISKDRWHTNVNVEHAALLCEKAGIQHRIQDKDDQNAIVPIGRSAFTYGFFSFFACHCHNPQHMYSPLIDETGKIYRCGFGAWDYTHVEEHLEGDFHCAFKEFGLKFNKVFIGNCARCIESYHSTLARENREQYRLTIS